MQQVSTAFIDILKSEGVTCLAYIDDIVGVNATREGAEKDFKRAIQLLQELGLEESREEKSPQFGYYMARSAL